MPCSSQNVARAETSAAVYNLRTTGNNAGATFAYLVVADEKLDVAIARLRSNLVRPPGGTI